MDDAGAVRAIERAGDLHRDRQRVASGSGRGRSIGERLALEVLHDEERGSMVLADVVERADVRMGELRDGARFRSNRARNCGSAASVSGRTFTATSTIEPGVAGFVDLAHAARAERADDFIRTESRPRLRHSGISR